MKDQKYKINKGVIVQKVGKNMTIFDPEESVMFTFNETAAFIYKQVKKKMNLPQIVEVLSRYYDISTEQARSDTEDFISDMVKKKILVLE